jgi:hypothetical protein
MKRERAKAHRRRTTSAQVLGPYVYTRQMLSLYESQCIREHPFQSETHTNVAAAFCRIPKSNIPADRVSG